MPLKNTPHDFTLVPDAKTVIDDFLNCTSVIKLNDVEELNILINFLRHLGEPLNRSTLDDSNISSFPYAFYDHNGIHGYKTNPLNRGSSFKTFYTLNDWLSTVCVSYDTDIEESEYEIDFLF